ncbi:anti-sigma factor [Mycolicibacterium sp. XJ870]
MTRLHRERLPRPQRPHTYRYRSVEVRVKARPERLSMLRTVLAALAAFEDLDLDTVADLQLAVDEACAVLINSAAADSILLVAVQPRADALVVRASTTCASPGDVGLGSFSRRVLAALTDEVSTFSEGPEPDGRQVFGIALTTRRRWASANC